MQPIAFDESNLNIHCDWLASRDNDLLAIIHQYGYPPMWKRPATFESLLHIILEQQVSLASAKAALTMLQQTIGEVTPEKVLQLSDEELKACYFSRQKTGYAKHLAASILDQSLVLDQLAQQDDTSVREQLRQIKGIGDWTSDVFLMMCLQRCDLFPLGDIALVKSMLEVKQLIPPISKEALLAIADQWKPYRTIAAFLLWHAYLQKRKKPAAPISTSPGLKGKMHPPA